MADPLGRNPKALESSNMKNQFESSITHSKNTESGLAVTEHREIGEGDSRVSLVRYSNGSTWMFDNAAATRIDYVYGFASANAYSEPAWFLTSELAVDFDRGCGGEFGEPEKQDADLVALESIMI